MALAPVRSLSLHPERALAATGSVDPKIRLWGELNQGIWQGHEDEVSSLAWNRNGTMLVSGGADSKVKLWRLHSQGVVRTLAGHPGAALAVVWQPGGGRLASAGRDSTVRFWDPLSGNQVKTIAKPDWAGLTALAWSPDGSFLAVAGSGGELEILDKSGQSCGATRTQSVALPGASTADTWPHRGSIRRFESGMSPQAAWFTISQVTMQR